MRSWIERNVGKSLTERKHPDFDVLVSACVLFFCVSQERVIDGWTFQEAEEKLNLRTSKEPKCGNGQRLYGVNSEGIMVKLLEIIDSSD